MLAISSLLHRRVEFASLAGEQQQQYLLASSAYRYSLTSSRYPEHLCAYSSMAAAECMSGYYSQQQAYSAVQGYRSSPPASCRTYTVFSGSQYPQSQRGSVRQAPMSSYSRHPSTVVGSRVSAMEPTMRVGYVPDMPPPDYFTSGAARIDSKTMRRAAMAEMRSRGEEDPTSRTVTRYSRSNTKPRSEFRGYIEDDCSVAPEDSISQVSSNRSRRSRKSIRSVRRDSVVGYEEDNGEWPWFEDEQPYFDEGNGYWQRNVRPSYTRGYT